MAMFEAKYYGAFPRRCDGKWLLRRNGVDVTGLIPAGLLHAPMNTRKKYSYVCAYSGKKVNKAFFEGLSAKKWIRRNSSWIWGICRGREEAFQLYHAINLADWVSGPCGDCCY